MLQITDMDEALASAVDIGEDDVSDFQLTFLTHKILRFRIRTRMFLGWSSRTAVFFNERFSILFFMCIIEPI